MDAVIINLLEMGIPNLILSFFAPLLSAFIVYFFMCRLLPNRLNIYSLCALSLVYALWFNLRDPDLFGTGYHLFMNIFINAFTYFIIIFIFKGKFWKKLIVWWYFDIIKTLCQAVAYVPILLNQSRRGFGGEWARLLSLVESDAPLKLIHMAVFISLFLLMGFLSLSIWRRILMHRFHSFYLLFFALPMGQIYSVARVIHPSMGDWFFGILYNFTPDVMTAYDILSLLGITLSLAASAAILLRILSQGKRAAIEAELMETKRVMELEQTRYAEMEKRSEELAKIRHDFNNQLASIIQLARLGEDGAAQEIISALANEINGAQNM